MSASGQAELDAAIRELAQGKPYRSAAYVLKHGLPFVANERFATALLTAFANKPAKYADEMADGYAEFRRLQEEERKDYRQASACILRQYDKFKIKNQSVLDNLIAGRRSDVNPTIRKRYPALMPAKF